MAVKDALDAITKRHPDVIGALVLHDGNVHHNLEAPYDMISTETVLETFSEIFEHTAMLEDEGLDFGEMIMDFANHSFIVRSIEGGILAVLAPRLQRGQLVKMHVGLGLFGKAVQKALEEDAESAAAPVTETHAPAENSAPEAAMEDATDESSIVRGFSRPRGGFRGTKEMIASRLAPAIDAISEPEPKEDVATTSEDGVPLNPDGTPKKKKYYRGQVYYE